MLGETGINTGVCMQTHMHRCTENIIQAHILHHTWVLCFDKRLNKSYKTPKTKQDKNDKEKNLLIPFVIINFIVIIDLKGMLYMTLYN